MSGPGHFESRAEVYDRARPPYPQALWDRLRELGLLRSGARVVELGAGSGLATAPLVAAGARVTAVEPGPALAGLLRRRLPAVTVHETTAEAARFDPGSFDLAVAATAVHWFDLDVVLPALHGWLRPDGALVVFRHAFGDPTVAPTPFRARVAAITGRRSGPPRPGPGELDTQEWATRLGGDGRFAPSHVEEFRWRAELSADGVRDLFSTFSDWSPDEVAEAGRAVEDLGGRVVEHYVVPLIVLRRRWVPPVLRSAV